jgi:uncharacterized protein (TIGR03437 family)
MGMTWGWRLILVSWMLGEVAGAILGQAPIREGALDQRIRETLLIPPLAEGGTWISPPLFLRPPDDSSMIALTTGWESVPGSRQIVLSRTSRDGLEWTGWVEVEAEVDGAAADPIERRESVDPGGELRQLAFSILAPGVRYLQYRLDGATFPAPARLEVGWFFSGVTSAAAREQIRRRAAGELGPDLERQMAPTSPHAFPRPPVVTRTEWGCPDGQITRHGTLRYTTVTHLIVHHTVNSNNASDWAAVVRSIWSFHVFDRQYSDLGYNYLIDPEGVIYEGRSGGDNVLGAHFSAVNGGTMGVALIGTFISQLPTPKARESLRRLLAWKADQRGLTPYIATLHGSSGLLLKVIAGHREGPAPTQCPGDRLFAWLPLLRVEVLQSMTGSTALSTVSAADFSARPLAPDSIAAAFGQDLSQTLTVASTSPLPTSLGDVSLRIRDASEVERPVPLFGISPSQVNLLLPADLALGPATLLLVRGETLWAAGSLSLGPISPGLFTANADGRGVPAALLLRVSREGAAQYEPVFELDASLSRAVPRVLLFGEETESLYLVLFGTGLRPGGSSPRNVTALLESGAGKGLLLDVLFAGATIEYAGLDQINLRLPRTLNGSGLQILTLRVDGLATNPVELFF